MKLAFFTACAVLLTGCTPAAAPEQATKSYDLLIENGIVYDGSGSAPQRVDVAIDGDRVAALLHADSGASAERVIDAQGLAVAPGFINVLSWATESLIADGRAMSDTKQGITLELFGEGWSMGPLNDAMKGDQRERQGDIRYDIEWTTLGEYLEYLVEREITPNVASFVGATTIRIHELGEADVQPDAGQLARMQELVRAAMREGALGVGSSLIYPPAFFASTDELIALSQAAAEYGGGYITHMRSEANRLLEAIDEAVGIARATGERVEIYHLKAAGEKNWPKMAQAVAKIEAARDAGLALSANMYAYTAGATGLTASMPPWVQEGGLDAWKQRLQDPATGARLEEEMRTPTDEWESLYLLSGSPERVLLVAFKQDSLKYLTGKSLAEVAAMRGVSPEIAAMDLVVADDSRVGTVYFLMSEDNVKRQITLPYMSFGSDAGSMATEGVFLRSNPHPRAYGNFARLLGKYVRDENVIPLEEAVRRLTSLPADNLKLRRRGTLKPGQYADIVVFDPATIMDHATFDQPHQYSTGVQHVLVNGVQVLRDGEHTGALPGRVVRGPGWTGWLDAY